MEIGGSDGPRTHRKSNAGLSEVGALSQGLSQDLQFPPELQEIVNSWSMLPQELKTAVLAIIRSLRSQSKKERSDG
jgi:hypothetical protein